MPSAVTAPLRGLQSFVITSASALLLIALLTRFLRSTGKESKNRRKTLKSVDDVGALVGTKEENDSAKFDFVIVGGGEILGSTVFSL